MKYFTKEEFDCQHTGENRMGAGIPRQTRRTRGPLWFSFVNTSGYRSLATL